MTDRKGFVHANPRGFGFAITAEGDEFFMSPNFLKKLFHGDEISFTVEAGRAEGTFQVATAALVRRSNNLFLGTLQQRGTSYYLDSDEPCFVGIQVDKPDSYVSGDVVAVTTRGISFNPPKPTRDLPSVLSGLLVSNLGARTRDGFDLDYALVKHGFNEEFPNEVLQECTFLEKSFLKNGIKLDGRVDLSSLDFITVDSASTQDFDDAIYAKAVAQGWEVYVAIADVAYYVPKGSALDREALARGTSVYLPGRTVPMLPKALSANLCALKESVLRCAVVLKALVDGTGNVVTSEVFKAVIQVRKNRTYDDVAAELASSQSGETSCVPALNAAYQALKSQVPASVNAGVEDAEPGYVKDGDGYSIKWTIRNEAHKLVEVFMLLANQEIAKNLIAKGFHKLFRHQPLPSLEKWAELRLWAQSVGHDLPEAPSREALGELAQSLSLENQLAGQLKIRSTMEQASYHEEEATHFSLGFLAYTHFTSPIRRYADLTVHRYLFEESATSELVAGECSERSRAAKFAERYVWDKLKKRLLISEVSATARVLSYIVGQSKFGLRVIAMPWQCVVTVKGSSLSQAGFTFDEESREWKGPESLMLGGYVNITGIELEEYKAKTELSASFVRTETAQLATAV